MQAEKHWPGWLDRRHRRLPDTTDGEQAAVDAERHLAVRKTRRAREARYVRQQHSAARCCRRG